MKVTLSPSSTTPMESTTRAAMGGVTLVVLDPLEVHAQTIEVGAALGDHLMDAELHRLQGDCVWQSNPAMRWRQRGVLRRPCG